MKNNNLNNLQTVDEKFAEEIVNEVVLDFNRRQQERSQLERQWELNINFYSGNQYCNVSSRGEIYESDKDFYWQNRSVYNHITPLIETRLAKFTKVVPIVSVRPLGDDEDEIKNAKMGEKLLNSFFHQKDIESIVNKATAWSEITGTSFYKVIWDNDGGNEIGNANGQTVYEGDVKILVVPSFEIFPDSLYTENLYEQKSIIHARAMPVSEIYEKYGETVDGSDVDVFNLNTNQNAKKRNGSTKKVEHNSAIVIEKYEKPTKKYPNGRLITVAGNKLLYYGELPYLNGEGGRKTYPFIKQEANAVSGNFFGVSVIDRLIPLQREYNAVKNRKHEFLNRISMGVMMVEDGSMDTDDLVDEGLSPGKVLIYRQGSTPPTMMDETVLPDSFSEEEDKLIKEFALVSGVTDMISTKGVLGVASGTAFELLIEQSNERLTVTASNIRKSYLEMSKQILRLYKQFVRGVRQVKEIDAYSQVKVFYVDRKAMTSDDVVLESENELLLTPLQKKDVVFKLYNSGLLHNENGKISPAIREKIVKLLGYKELIDNAGIASMQEEKAQEENKIITNGETEVDIIDDHEIHIDVHTRFMLGEYTNLTEKQKQNISLHIKKHKQNLKTNIEEKGNGTI